MFITAEEFYKDFKEHLQTEYEKNNMDFLNMYTNNCSTPLDNEIEKSKDTEIDTPIEQRRKHLWTEFLDNCFKKILYSDNQQKHIYNEYFRIDTTGWSEKKEGYNWNFDIAIEYENKKSKWTYEFKKLCHIISDLRVVVGYERKENNCEESIKDKTNQCIEVITEKAKLGDKDKDTFLIIVGNCQQNYTKLKDIDFKPYLWNGKEFIQQCW